MKHGLPISAVHHVTRLAREMKRFETLDLHVANGRADLKLRAKRKRATFVRDMAGLLAAWFLEKKGRNYVEMELIAPPLTEQIPPGWERCIGPLILTVQRRAGQTPHQLRVKAEAERDALLAQARPSDGLRVYPAYAGGHDPLSLVAAWNALHPDTPLIVVDDAFVTCQAYLVIGAAYETAQTTLRGLPDRPVIWLDEDHTTAVFADREGFLGGHAAEFAEVFPRKRMNVTLTVHDFCSRACTDLYDMDYSDMRDEQLAEVTGSFSVDDGPAGEFDNLLAAINACKDMAATNNTCSYVYEHCAGTQHDVWEVDGRDSGGDEADGEETRNEYNVELAVCWPDHIWTTDRVQLNGDHLLTDEPADGEIWEAAHDRWIAEHPNIERVALGLYSWQRLEEKRDNEEGWIDSHSVNCLECGALVDERKCLPGPNGEGDICPTCIAKYGSPQV